MKTIKSFIKITSRKNFEHLGLRKTKTAIFRELTVLVSKIGTEYSYIHVHVGSRGGLRGFIAHYPKGKGAYLRSAEYTMFKYKKIPPRGDVVRRASPRNDPQKQSEFR